jgi:hypothetical protein
MHGLGGCNREVAGAAENVVSPLAAFALGLGAAHNDTAIREATLFGDGMRVGVVSLSRHGGATMADSGRWSTELMGWFLAPPVSSTRFCNQGKAAGGSCESVNQ